MTLSEPYRAHETAAAAAWAAECYKPERERQYFSFDEIANALARRPRRLEVDNAESNRILRDLADWVSRGKFGASDVVILSGGNSPPDFVPLTPLIPGEIFVTGDNTLIRRHGGSPGRYASIRLATLATLSEMLFLRRCAVRQYIENSELEGAARVMREWFPEAAAPSDEAALAGDSATVHTGTTPAIEAEEKGRGPWGAHESSDEEPALGETSVANDPPPVDVQGTTSDVVDQPAEKQSAPSSRKRGRRPSRFKQVVYMMTQKIAKGDLTREQLSEMLEKELERDFGASRDTCRKARYAVLDGPPES